jgi:hypothetical protein
MRQLMDRNQGRARDEEPKGVSLADFLQSRLF